MRAFGDAEVRQLQQGGGLPVQQCIQQRSLVGVERTTVDQQTREGIGVECRRAFAGRLAAAVDTALVPACQRLPASEFRDSCEQRARRGRFRHAGLPRGPARWR